MAALLDRIDHQDDCVGFFCAFPCSADHRTVQTAAGLKNAGRVDQNDLRLPVQGDAHQPRSGCLRLGTGNRHFLADQIVDQCTFSGIGRADNCHDTAV